MIEINWLNKLLEPNSQREITKHVWRYMDKVVATNGFAMIVINADLVDCANFNHSLGAPENKVLSEIINHEYGLSQAMKVNLQDFKKFLGEPEGVKECNCKSRPKCPECNGKGTIECNLNEEHDCGECRGGSEYYCDKCVDGWIKPKPRYISIFGVVVNGSVLSQYLQGLHDAYAIMACDRDRQVKLSGNGWDVYIMPVKDVWQEVRKYEQKGESIKHD